MKAEIFTRKSAKQESHVELGSYVPRPLPSSQLLFLLSLALHNLQLKNKNSLWVFSITFLNLVSHRKDTSVG